MTDAPPPRPGRRRLIGGVALAAAASGLGWSLWRSGDAGGASGTADASAALWTLRFPQPGGGELALSSMRGRPWVLNFWATWCPPCVKEMPELDRFRQAHAGRGWEVVGLAIDGPTPVREFLQRVPVSFPIGLAGFGGTELVRQLGNDSGALPYTVVFDRQGRVQQRKVGDTNFDELSHWARQVGDAG